ncbi:MAG: nucleolar protein 56 [Methanoculleus sp.]|nr:nucleolar protein 56 [Methanoculleus sp.]
MLQRYWFGDVDEVGCRAAGTDPAALAERAAALRTGMDSFVPIDWETARDCGVVRTREEYVDLLRSVCTTLARKKIALSYQGRDVELLQMVRMLDELDNVINLLSERAAEWYQVTNPSFSRKYRSLPAKKMLGIIRKGARGGLSDAAEEIDRLAGTRSRLMREVSARADEVMPNTSALIGGLVAARLLSKAGGLPALARMPGSTIQVLGSERALFSHLRGGTPPPKHGIIFQHRRVHNAPKPVRGRVARVLAAKLAIAARLDYYRGEAVPEFLKDAQARIDEAGVEAS